MSDKTPLERVVTEATVPSGQLVYLVQRDSRDDEDDTIDLSALWQLVWENKWMLVLSLAVFSTMGAVYSVYATPWYRAEVSLLPAENNTNQGLSGQLAQLGGLASLAGINIGGGDKAEPLAVLKSRDFAKGFIEEEKLLTVLLADRWDAESGKWKGRAGTAPDIRDAVKYFDKHVRRITEDRKAGLITLAVEWKDPNVAATWANALANRVNEQMRERALANARASVAYLQAELATTGQIALQQATGRLLESELEKIMVARGRDEFAFRIIDKAQVPRIPYKPQFLPIVFGSAFLGGLVAISIVFVRGLRSGRLRRASRQAGLFRPATG